MKAEESSKLSYKVSDVGDGKGRGLVATRTLEAGEVIVIEEPLLVVYSTENEDILEELTNSSPEVKAGIMSLSDLGDLDFGCANFFSSLTLENQHPDIKMLEVLMRKFRANMHSAPGESEDDSCAIYETICLINHSCSPNAICVDNEDGERFEVRACQRILEGEEILVSYYIFSDLPSRQERIAEIQEDRYFQCRCGLCSLSGEDLAEDESIRLKIRELSNEIERLESNPVEALKKAESKLELMENIRDRVILRFPHHLLTCYKLAKLVNCSKQMTKFREKVLKQTMTLGHNYQRYYTDLMD